MKPKSKISIILLPLVIVLVNTVHAQQLFYCDSIFSPDQRRFEGACNEFYEFTENKIDSVVMKEYAKDNWRSVPIQIIAPVNQEMKVHGVVYGTIAADTVFKIDYVNGAPDGYYIRFCRNDTLSVTAYNNGKKNGLEIIRPSCDSSFYIKTTYAKGVEIGPYLVIENGKFRGLTAILNGKIHGAQYELYEEGTLEWFLVYENGKVKDGTYCHFDSNGRIIEAQTYRKGKLRKSIKYYDDEPPKVTRYK